MDHFGAQGEKAEAEEEDAELVLTEDERRGVALLTDEAVGMAPRMARQLVRLYDFEGLCRQVATWWDELEQGVVRGTGALVHQLRHRFSVARQFDAFLGSELFERHGLAAVLGPRKRSVLEEFADVIIR